MLQLIKKVALSPDHTDRTSTKISIFLRHIEFNVISYIESKKKTLHKSLKIFTIATMELYPLKFNKIADKIANKRNYKKLTQNEEFYGC